MFPWLNLVGIASIIATALLFSSNRKAIKPRLIITAMGLQFLIGFLILKTELGNTIFNNIAAGVTKLYQFAHEGASFVFGSLADGSGPWGVVFAIKVIPIIIFFGALMALLFHLGIIQRVVVGIAFLMRPLLGTSGAETLCAAANSMFGQTESPLLIKHYLPRMTESEILVVMVSGMATLSGSIMAVYGSLGVSMMHMLCASMMAVPGSILISKILIPETGKPETSGKQQLEMPKTTSSILDAISTGTSDGMMLAANVAAMLITFISLIALINFSIKSTLGISLDECFGMMFRWVAYIIGINKEECDIAGTLLGQKLVINEFVAYANMMKESLSERSSIILTYALCGFANFSCIGIQIGGIGALAPSQRHTLIKLGMLALFGATLTNFLNAAIVGLLI
jgi:CNT family concentrative nucleoside transporter